MRPGVRWCCQDRVSAPSFLFFQQKHVHLCILYNGFPSVVKSILSASINKRCISLRLSTSLLSFTAREGSLNFIFFHCMQLLDVMFYWLLLCNPVGEENAATAGWLVERSGWNQRDFIVSILSPFTAVCSICELLRRKSLSGGEAHHWPLHHLDFDCVTEIIFSYNPPFNHGLIKLDALYRCIVT